MSINSIGTDIPIEVNKGGIGVATLTQYGVLYGNAAAPVQVTAVGTAGNVLTSNGPGLAPTFQAVGGSPGAGAWTFIETQIAATSANLTFNPGQTPQYTCLFFTLNSITSDTINDQLVFEISFDNGSTFPTNSITGTVVYSSTTTGVFTTNSGSAGFRCPISAPFIQTDPTLSFSGVMYFFTPSTFGSTINKNISGNFNLPISSVSPSSMYFGFISGSSNMSGIPTSYRFKMKTGNIETGYISMYGVKNS